MQAEQRHELLVHALIEATKAYHVRGRKLVLDEQVEITCALHAETVGVSRTAERRKRPLGRQPRSGARRFGGQELVGARCDHPLRERCGHAGVLERFKGQTDSWAEQTAPIEIVAQA
jgi:hypothetical protein